MSKIIGIVCFLASLASFTIGPIDFGAEALIASNLVRQPGVKVCLDQFEGRGGRAQILSMTRVSNADGLFYFLEGVTEMGGVSVGPWEIKVVDNGADDQGQTNYLCEVTSNLE